MVNLLSKRVAKRTDKLAPELPAASKDTVKSHEQCDGQKSAARNAMPTVAAAISVVAVRAEVRPLEAVRIPEWPKDETDYQRNSDEDNYGWDND
jgi:hypothetical protein